MRAEPVIASDETSARVEGQTCWQWVFGSATAVAHRIAVSRGAAVAADFLKGATPDVWIRRPAGAQMGQTAETHERASPICCATPGTRLTPGMNCLRRAASLLLGRAVRHRPQAREFARTAPLLARRRSLDSPASVACWRFSPYGGRAQSRGVASRNAADKLAASSPARDVPPTDDACEPAWLRPSADLPARSTDGVPLGLGARASRRLIEALPPA